MKDRLAAGMIAGGLCATTAFAAPGAASAITATAQAFRATAAAEARLLVRVTAHPLVAQPGRPLSYRVQVRNTGSGPAVAPVLRVRLPDGMRPVGTNVAECRPAATMAAPKGAARGAARGMEPAGGKPTSAEVVCASGLDVPAGASGEVTVVGTVAESARGPLRARATLETRAAATAASGEVLDTAWVVTPVADGADLSVRLVRAESDERTDVVRAVIRNNGDTVVRDARLFARVQTQPPPRPEPRRAAPGAGESRPPEDGRSVPAGSRSALSGATLGAMFGPVKEATCRPSPKYLVCGLPVLWPNGETTVRLPLRRDREVPLIVRALVHSDAVGDRQPKDNSASIRLQAR